MAVVAVAVLAGACDGGSVPPEVADRASTTTTLPVPPPSAGACSRDHGVGSEGDAPLALSVAPLGELVQGQVSWTVTVANTGSGAVRLVYPSTRDGDVVLRDRSGREVYRWSRGLAFEPTRRCQVLPPGRSARTFLGGVLRVPPGRYELVATLSSDPAPPPVRATVEVSAPG